MENAGNTDTAVMLEVKVTTIGKNLFGHNLIDEIGLKIFIYLSIFTPSSIIILYKVA
ncbi:MAG: hypothetical protein ACI9RO_001401 [Alteromonas macleodii]|jgi:hypothetical protein